MIENFRSSHISWQNWAKTMIKRAATRRPSGDHNRIRNKIILKNHTTLNKHNLAKNEVSFQSFFATYVHVTESKMSHCLMTFNIQLKQISMHYDDCQVKSAPSCSEYSAKTRRDVFHQMRLSKFTVCLLFCTCIVL